MDILSTIALGFIFLCSIIALLRWNEVRYGKKGLPPGTMGWPLFGETPDFLRYGQQFIKNRKARYGDLFKTHILGCPTVISTDPALNRYILLNEGRGLIPGYPQSMLDILGKWNIAAVQSDLHKTMRGAMLALINPSMIKGHLLSDINEFMDIHLQHWNDRVINLQDKTKEMVLLLSLQQVMSIKSGLKAEAFVSEFCKLVEGTISMPINLPGTSYKRGFQARENILRMLREVLKERRASMDTYNDMIAMLLNDKEEEADGVSANCKLTDEQIFDLLISIINAGYETVSTTTMMAVKYLHDSPEALRELREEHLAIQRRKIESQEPTSPKVSCIGQVKLKKHMCKAKVKAKDRSWDRPVLRIKEIKSELSSPRGIKALQLKKFFSFSREKKPEQTVSDSEFAPEAGVPSLGQLKRFSCRRDKGASLANIFQDSVQDDFKCSPTNKSEESRDEDKGDVRKFASDDQELESPKNEDEDQKLESPKNEDEDQKLESPKNEDEDWNLENPQNEDEDWNLENPGNEDEDWNLENPKAVLISHSAPLLSEPLPKPAATNGQPSEINLWKRRSVAAPWALDLKSSYLLEMRGPATL